MNLDKLTGLVAPHRCLGCRLEGALLCKWCLPQMWASLPSRCFLCHKLTTESATCQNCRSKTGLKHVWSSADFDGLAKQLIERLKFARTKQAAFIVSQIMADTLPRLSGTIMTHLPTASSRQRQRGYDQSYLIAKRLARQTKMPYKTLLLRRGYTRQTGADKQQRQKQLENSFLAVNAKLLRQYDNVLLIDDVLTTGASLSAAARSLKKAGAKSVDAAVFACKI